MVKKVLYKLPFHIKDGAGRVLKRDSFERHLVSEGRDFHFGAGLLSKEDFFREGFFVLNKHRVSLFGASFIDYYSRLSRGAQVISKKDIGPIITKAGLNRFSRVIDAGAGSGGLCCFLGMVVERVDSFDVSEKNLEVVRKNIDLLGLGNVFVSLKDIYVADSFLEGEYDVFTLDVPEPWRAWGTALRVLKLGGFFVVYSPNVFQVREVVMGMPDSFFLEEVVEVIEREWSISERVSRPVTKDFSHTAFLAFFRKIGN